MSCALLLASVGGAAAAGTETRPTTLEALQSWVDAVRAHEPGRTDAAADFASKLSLDTRKAMDAGMPLFLDALTRDKFGINLTDASARLIADLARRLRGDPGARAFLERAAVLHSDAGAYSDPSLVTRELPDATSIRTETAVGQFWDVGIQSREDSRNHPLLTNSTIAIDKDGQVLGSAAASWNWPFARYLLDRVPVDDPFVGAWYHATAAFMFARKLYGEATQHLQRAAERLPEDPRILFDRACYAENLGLPMHQVLLPDAEDVRNRLDRATLTRIPSNAAASGIPKAAVTNSAAEELFRHTLRVDPSYVEARVRLGRLLTVRKRYDEAAAELNAVLAQSPSDRMVAFYANLFAGRTAQALGRLDDASRDYHEAVALFPDAQSALLASSQIALLRSDVPATLAPVERLGPASSVFTADPWWQYGLAAGRDAERLLRDVWERAATSR